MVATHVLSIQCNTEFVVVQDDVDDSGGKHRLRTPTRIPPKPAVQGREDGEKSVYHLK